MIFVTVGGQIPFDRLIRAADSWAGARKYSDVFAQIGTSGFHPRHMQWVEFLDPREFRATLECASALVAHAGMGSIITGLEFGKPILVMPRRGDLRETRNDHQVDTARRLQARGYVETAFDEKQLWDGLDALALAGERERIDGYAPPELLAALRDFIEAA